MLAYLDVRLTDLRILGVPLSHILHTLVALCGLLEGLFTLHEIHCLRVLRSQCGNCLGLVAWIRCERGDRAIDIPVAHVHGRVVEVSRIRVPVKHNVVRFEHFERRAAVP